MHKNSPNSVHTLSFYVRTYVLVFVHSTRPRARAVLRHVLEGNPRNGLRSCVLDTP